MKVISLAISQHPQPIRRCSLAVHPSTVSWSSPIVPEVHSLVVASTLKYPICWCRWSLCVDVPPLDAPYISSDSPRPRCGYADFAVIEMVFVIARCSPGRPFPKVWTNAFVERYWSRLRSPYWDNVLLNNILKLIFFVTLSDRELNCFIRKENKKTSQHSFIKYIF